MTVTAAENSSPCHATKICVWSQWDDGRVSTSASVAVPTAPTGADLRDSLPLEAVRDLTHGIVGVNGNSVVFDRSSCCVLANRGSAATLWTGRSKAACWSDGLAATGEVKAGGGGVEATLVGYEPSLPLLLYTLTQLQVHQLFTRLYLLRLRGPEPLPGAPATSRNRLRAATVDAAFCLTLAGLTDGAACERTLAIAIAYHVACWSLGGRTLGGLVVGQRVIAVDGSRLTPTQSLLRLVLLPVSWVRAHSRAG